MSVLVALFVGAAIGSFLGFMAASLAAMASQSEHRARREPVPYLEPDREDLIRRWKETYRHIFGEEITDERAQKAVDQYIADTRSIWEEHQTRRNT